MSAVTVITLELTSELRRLKPEPIEPLTPKRDGTPLQWIAYEARDKRFIAHLRARLVGLQTWLTVHCDEHRTTEPFGMPEWISALAEFDFVERALSELSAQPRISLIFTVTEAVIPD